MLFISSNKISECYFGIFADNHTVWFLNSHQCPLLACLHMQGISFQRLDCPSFSSGITWPMVILDQPYTFGRLYFYLIVNAIDFFFGWKWPTSRVLKKEIPPEGRSDFCWKWTVVLECRMYAWRTSRPAKISCGHLEPSGDFLRKACRTSMSRPTTNM